MYIAPKNPLRTLPTTQQENEWKVLTYSSENKKCECHLFKWHLNKGKNAQSHQSRKKYKIMIWDTTFHLLTWPKLQRFLTVFLKRWASHPLMVGRNTKLCILFWRAIW